MLTKTVPARLTVIRGNAILKLLRDEEGFHDGNVWGPFSFAFVLLLRSLLLPEVLVELAEIGGEIISEPDRILGLQRKRINLAIARRLGRH
jgi:hypothetical protein